MFGDQADSDERALVYGAMITGYPFDNVKLRRAADAGNAFAQAWMAFRSLGPERFKFASMSAAQKERDGYFELARQEKLVCALLLC